MYDVLAEVLLHDDHFEGLFCGLANAMRNAPLITLKSLSVPKFLSIVELSNLFSNPLKKFPLSLASEIGPVVDFQILQVYRIKTCQN